MRTTDWIGNAVSIALFSLLALGSWGLSEFLQRSRVIANVSEAAGPNAVIEQARVVRSDKEGTPRLVLDARRIEHFDQNDSSRLESPRLLATEPGKAPTTVAAQRAVTSENQNRIDLSGDVLISREANASQPLLRVSTSRATIFVQEERAITDAPVLVQRGSSTLQGVGMRLDQKTQKLEIISESRMVVPKAGEKR